MPSIGGTLELIGVRAVILDVRNYVADGQRIKNTNAQIAKSIDDVAKKRAQVAASEAKLTTVKAGHATEEDIARAVKKEAEARAAVTKALNAQTAAREKLTLAQQKVEATQGRVTGAEAAITAAGATGVTEAEQARLAAAGARARESAAVALRQQQTALRQFGDAQAAVTAKEAAAAVATENLNRLRAAPTAKQVAQAEKELEAATVATTKAELAQSAAEEKLSVNQAARIKTATQLAAAAAVVAVGVGIATAVKQASQFQDSLSKINNLTNLTTQETAALGKEILKMTQEIPKSPSDLGAAAYVILSSGITNAAEAEDILRQSAKAATAGFGDTKEIATAVTGIIKAYGEQNITAAQATDILFAAVKEGRAEISDFAQNIGRVTQLGRNLGIGFDQIAAATAGLTNVGIPAHQAVTALLGILNQIFSPAEGAKEELASVGISIEQLRANIRDKGLLPALQDMLKQFGNNQQALEKLFPDVRGLSGALALLRDNGTENARILANVAKSSGIVGRAFNDTKDNLSSLVQLLKNQVSVLFIEIGTAILPAVSAGLKNLIGWVSRNHEGIRSFATEAVQTLIYAFGLLTKAIGAVIKTFEDLTAPMAFLIGRSNATKLALLGIGAGLVWALPGGPIIVGLTAIVALLHELTATGGLGDKISNKINDFFGLQHGSLAEGIQKAFDEGAKSIEEAIKQSVPKAFQGEVLGKLQVGGVDTSKGVEELKRLQNEVDLTDNNLKKIPPDFADVSLGASQLDSEIKKLAEDFQKGSEAAGQVKSLTADLGLFGEVSQELANKLGLSAKAAGNIQGFDAFVNAGKRVTAEAYNMTAALATVAAAFQRSEQVAQNIVLGLARSALAASQAAAQTLFGRPTREVANLNVSLAQANLSRAQTSAATNPQLNTLKHQLDAINKQIDAANKQASAQKDSNKAIQEASRSAKNAAQQQLDQLKLNNQAAQDASDALLDQMRLANDEARAAFDRQNSQFERLISATQQQASDLQAAFLKSNEDLQRQINQAIGAGDTATALDLTHKQRDAAKAYQAQAKTLRDNEQQLTKQQKQAQLDENDRAREAQLAIERAEVEAKAAERLRRAQEALIESTVNAISSAESNTQAQTDNTSAIESNISSLEKHRDAIQEQIDSLSNATDVQDENAQAIQDQISIYQAQSGVLQAMVEAADATLLTQDEQAAKAKELINQIIIESNAVRDLAQKTNQDLIPQMDEARLKFEALQGTLDVLTNESIRNNFIDKGIDPAAEQLRLLAIATGEATASQKAATSTGKILPPQFEGGAGLKDINAAAEAVAGATIVVADNERTFAGAIATGTIGIATATSTGAADIAEQARAASVGIANAGRDAAAEISGSSGQIARAVAEGTASVTDASQKGSIAIATASEEGARLISAGTTEVQAAYDTSARAIAVSGNNVVTAISSVAANIANAARNILNSISAAGSSVIGGITGAAKAAASAISAAAGAAAAAAKAAATAAAKAATTTPKKSAYGGIYNSPTLTWVGETHQREAIVPLERPFRARQILGSIPPSVLASILPRRMGGAVFAPNITVTGETLDSMEAAAIRALHRAFRDARTTSIRKGGLVTQGLGPSF